MLAGDRLTRVRQTGSVQDCLLRFNEALADCRGLADEEKRSVFIQGLQRDITRNIRAVGPASTVEIINLEVEISYEPASQSSPERRRIRW